MSLYACLLLTLGVFAFMFWPERNPFVQADTLRDRIRRETEY